MIQDNYGKLWELMESVAKIYIRRKIASTLISKLNSLHREKNSELVLSPARKNTSPIEQVEGLSERESYRQSQTDPYDKSAEIVISNLKYGDYVHIEKTIEACQFRVYSQLNSLKLDSEEDTFDNVVNFRRCCFRICNPTEDFSLQTQPLRSRSLVCLKNCFTGLYIEATSRISQTQNFQFDAQLGSKSQIEAIFNLQALDGTDCSISTNQHLCIRSFKNANLYLGVGNDEKRVFCSYQSYSFRLNKVKNTESLFNIPLFYIKSYHAQQYLAVDELSITALLTKKTLDNVEIEDLKGQRERCSQPFSLRSLESKPADSQVVFTARVKDMNTVAGIWMMQPCTNFPDHKILTHLASGQGLSVREQSLRLTSVRTKFTQFRVEQDRDFQKITDSDGHLVVVAVGDDGKPCLKIQNSKDYEEADRVEKSFFQFVKVEEHKATQLMGLIEIRIILKGLFAFFQKWGFTVDEQSEMSCFSSEFIMQTTLLTTRKIEQMFRLIEKMSELLDDQRIHLQYLQTAIKQLKIFELLMNMCVNLLAKFQKSETIDTGDFAQKHLENLLFRILQLLFKLIQNNSVCSSVLIGLATLFNRLLQMYPQKIGIILQQAIKNLSIFTTRAVHQDNSLLQWTKLIASPTVNTVKIQQNYVDIVAEVVVDPSDIGIYSYQNMVKGLLFTGQQKQKAMPRFGVLSLNKLELPCVIFESANLPVFNSTALKQLHRAESDPNAFFLFSFFKDRKANEALTVYVDYITSIIRLIRNLCKDRNRSRKFKMIAEDRGLSHNHISLVFRQANVGWELLTAYLSLYAVMNIDQDPFLPFEKREIKCHSWTKLQDYELSLKTCILFKQYTDLSLVQQRHRLFDAHFLPILDNFFGFIDLHEIDNGVGISFVTVVNVLFQIVNFGYLNPTQIKRYVKKVLKSADAVLEFYFHDSSFSERVLKSVSRLLVLVEQIWTIIHGLNVLKILYKKQIKLSRVFTVQEIKQMCVKIVDNQYEVMDGLDSRRNPRQEDEEIQQALKKRTYNRTSFRLNTHKAETDFESTALKFVLKQLFDGRFLYNGEGYLKLIQNLELIRLRGKRQEQFLRSVLFITNEKELTIYDEYSGRIPSKLSDVLKIKELVQKILRYQIDDEGVQKLQAIKYLDQLITKINRTLSSYCQQDFSLFRKCQSILEKLSVHHLLSGILDQFEEFGFEDLINRIYAFYLEFTYLNQVNQRILASDQYFTRFLKKFSFQALPKLLARLFRMLNNKQGAFTAIYESLERKMPLQEKQLVIETISRVLTATQEPELIDKFQNRLILQIIVSQEFHKYLICQSFSQNFGSIICSIAKKSQLLRTKFRSLHQRREIFAKLVEESNKYEEKKIYLKYYFCLFIDQRPLDSKDCNDLIRQVLLPELKHLPSVIRNILKPHNHFWSSQSASLQSIFQDLLLQGRGTLPQSFNVKKYIEYLINPIDTEDCTLLRLIEYLVETYNQNDKCAINELAQYLLSISIFLNKICFELEDQQCYQISDHINRILQLITEKHFIILLDPKVVNFQRDVEIVKNFFIDLAGFIQRNNINFHEIFSRSKISQTAIEPYFIFETDFVKCIQKISVKVNNRRDFSETITKKRIKVFFAVFGESDRRKMNLTLFLQKLLEVFQFVKNVEIKEMNERLFSSQQSGISTRNTSSDLEADLGEKQILLEIACVCEHLCEMNQFLRKKVVTKFKDILSLDGPKNISGKQYLSIFLGNASYDLFKIHEKHGKAVMLDSLICELLKLLNEQRMPLRHSAENRSEYIEFLICNISSQRPVSIDIFGQLYLNMCLTNESQSLYESIRTVLSLVNAKVFTCEPQNLVAFDKCYKFISTVVKHLPTTSSFREHIQSEIANTIIKAITKYSKTQSLYEFKLCEILLEVIIKDFNQCQVAATILSQHQTFTEVTREWTQKCMQATLRSINSNSLALCRLTGLLLELIIKFDLKKYDSQNAHMLNKMPFLLLHECFDRDFKDFALKMMNQDEECEGSNQCSSEFCNHLKVSAYDRNVLDFLIYLLIIIQIAVRLHACRRFPQPIASCDQMFLQNIRKLLNRDAPSSAHYNFGMIRWIDIVVGENKPQRIYFQLPTLSRHLALEHKTIVCRSIKESSRENLFEHLYELSVFLQKQLVDYDGYSKSCLKSAILYRKLLNIAVLVLLVAVCINIVFFFSPLALPLYFGFIAFSFTVKMIELYSLTRRLLNELSLLGGKEVRFPFILKDLFCQYRFLHAIALTGGYLGMITDSRAAGICFLLQALRVEVVSTLVRLTLEGLKQCYWIFLVEYALLLLFTETVFTEQTGLNPFQVHLALISQLLLVNFRNLQIDPQLFPILLNNLGLIVLFKLLSVVAIGVFGASLTQKIIGETRKELSEQRSCLLCGITNETDSPEMRQHMKYDHNVWNYLYFFIHLRNAKDKKSAGQDVKQLVESRQYHLLRLV